MKYQLTHIEDGKYKDLPSAVNPEAIQEFLAKTIPLEIIESVHIMLNTGDEVIFVKGTD
jgi:hypothetical protein